MDGFADVDHICTHLNRQGNLADHVTGVGANNAAAQDFAVAVRFRAVIKQQFGEAFVAAVGNRAAGCRPREQAFFDLDALGFGFVFGQANPGHFGVGVGDAGDDAGIKRCGCQLFVALRIVTNRVFV